MSSSNFLPVKCYGGTASSASSDALVEAFDASRGQKSTCNDQLFREPTTMGTPTKSHTAGGPLWILPFGNLYGSIVCRNPTESSTAGHSRDMPIYT